nr:immunoglobulin light chain junction region [Mus musculus]NSM00711.1 immunoglobulin light chain junction region [Mus musculus]
CAQNLELPPTF